MNRICCLLSLGLFLALTSTGRAASFSKVRFQAHFSSNYIASIYSLAEVVFGCDTLLRYVKMDSVDMQTLKKGRYLFQFGNGLSGELTYPTFFLPSYLGISSAKEYVAFVDDLKKGLQQNDFTAFLKKYPVDFSDKFLAGKRQFFARSNEEWSREVRPKLDEYFRVLNVFVKYAYEYERRFWKEDRRILQARADVLNQKFADEDIIARWEKLLGMRFNGDYHISLCRYNGDGPDANSLSFDRNLFYAGSDDGYLFDFISHEVGTHLLYEDAFSTDELKVLRDTHERPFYAGFETLAMFYNQQLLGRKLCYNLDFFKGNEYGAIYKNAYHQGIRAAELLRIGVELMVERGK